MILCETKAIIICIALLLGHAVAQPELSNSRQQSESKVSYLTLHARADPSSALGADPYTALSEAELRQYWSEPREDYASELRALRGLVSHLEHVTVQLVLIGEWSALASQIRAQLIRTVHLPYQAVVTPANTTFYPSHKRMHYSVTVQDRSTALYRSLAALHSTHAHVQQSQVDAILRSQSRDEHVHTVYLFWHAGTRGYEHGGACPCSLWPAQQQRYVWLDLAALALQSHGPRHQGDGLAPRLDLPNMDTAALSTYVSSLVTRVIDQVIAPRVSYPPLLVSDLAREIEVVIVHVTRARADTPLWDHALVQSVLATESLPKFGHRVVQSRVVRKSLEDCLICRRLHRSALKSRASAYVDSAGTVQSYARQYWDSHVIREFMRRHVTELIGSEARDRRVLPVLVLETDEHVTLSSEPPSDTLTADTWSHAYPELIVAVQPRDRNLQRDLDHSCDAQVVVQTADRAPTRAVLAQLLQRLWGIGPEHVTLQYSAAHHLALQQFQSHMHEILHIDTRHMSISDTHHSVTGVTQLTHDWLFARMPSIFSPYSSCTALSQLQIDAAHVNHVLLLTDHVLAQMRGVQQHLTLLTGVIDPQLTRRVNLMLFKLKLAFQFSEQLAYESIGAVLSSILVHDLTAVHELLHHHVPHAAELSLDQGAARDWSAASLVLATSCLFWLGVALSLARK